jgi:hypothetical protein
MIIGKKIECEKKNDLTNKRMKAQQSLSNPQQ